MSGRAVRVQALEPADLEENLTSAAKIVGDQGTILELKKTEWRNGLKRFVVAVSEPCEDPKAAKWKKVTPMDLENLGDLFGPKDVAVLEQIFREFHEVSPDEIKAITGKAQAVSAG
jgi:hypothetical protein